MRGIPVYTGIEREDLLRTLHLVKKQLRFCIRFRLRVETEVQLLAGVAAVALHVADNLLIGPGLCLRWLFTCQVVVKFFNQRRCEL